MIQGLILHSVSYSGSWGQQFLPLEEFIGKAAALGYDGVMLMAKRPHLSVLDWSPDVKARIRARLEGHGLRIACIAWYSNFTADLQHGDLPHPELRVRHGQDPAATRRA